MKRILVPLLAAALLPAQLAAQPAKRRQAEARRQYQRGAALFKQGKHDAAIAAYQAAYDLAPRPALLFNIARAHHEAGRREEALEHYRRYLEAEPGGAVAAEAREYAATLERELSPPPPAAAPPPEVAAPPPAQVAAAPAPEPGPPPPRVEPTPAPPPASVAVPAPPPARARRLEVGARIGASWSTFSYEPLEADPKLGLAGGLFACWSPIGDRLRLGLQLELLYVQKPAEPIDELGRFALDYVEIPLLARVGLRPLYLVAGAYYGLLVSEETPYHDEIAGSDAGLVAGVGASFALGPGALIVDVRYDHGLLRVKDNAEGSAGTRAFVAGIGWSF
jgi:tetratricopeptide (TPR) repeat protein